MSGNSKEPVEQQDDAQLGPPLTVVRHYLPHVLSTSDELDWIRLQVGFWCGCNDVMHASMLVFGGKYVQYMYVLCTCMIVCAGGHVRRA